MIDRGAIIQPFVDVAELTRGIAKAHVAYQDAERALQAAERKTDGLRQDQQRRRLELGRMLIEAKRGIKHGGWLPYLEKLGIANQTANEWMREAGFLEEQGKFPASDNAGNLANPANTRVASGVDKRSRKRDVPRKREPEPIDFGREICRLHNDACTFAEKVTANDRKRIAHQLRETALIIEEMP